MTGIGSAYDVRGLLSGQQINALNSDRRQVTLPPTGAGAPIQVNYGNTPVVGRVLAYGVDSPEVLKIAVGWGYGPLKQIRAVFINDQALPSDVQVKHYRGTTWQSADQWLADVIVAYGDDLILDKPGVGQIGIAYSVLYIPSGALTGITSIKAIVDGKLVNDPTSAGTGDPFTDETGFSITFTDASPVAVTDDSTHAHTVTLGGNPDIVGNWLELDGNGDYYQIAAHSSLEFGSDNWTFETRLAIGSVSGTDYIASKGTSSSPNRSFIVVRVGTELRIFLSSNGTDFDIANSETIYTGLALTSPRTEIDLKVEFDGREYIAEVDGLRTWSLRSSATVYDNSYDFYGGALNGAGSTTFEGAVSAARLTIGSARYFCDHTITNTPFSDSGTYTAGQVYSDNPALCWGDLASSAYYGLGAAVDGVAEAAAWCDSLIGGVTERCRVSLSIYETRTVESYLDLLATYAESIWLNEGENVKIRPDNPVTVDNPTGADVYTPYTFPSDTSDWTKTNGVVWGGGYYVRAVPSPAVDGTLSRPVDIEAGVPYVVELDCAAVTVGDFSVTLGGETVIAAQSTAGVYTGEITVVTTSPLPELTLIWHAECNAWVQSLRIRRKIWLENRVMADTLRLTPDSDLDTPTKVNVLWREPSTTSPTWEEKTASYTLPGVAEGDIPLRELSINMKHVFRQEEAENKAEARCQRLQNRVRVDWTTADQGVIYQKGDAVQVRNTYRGVDITVKLTSTNMSDYGRFPVSGYYYSESHYPSELQAGTGTVPEGLILLHSGASVPSGWSLFSDANGQFIKAWNDAVFPVEVAGDTGGSATHAGFSGNTDNGGAHATADTTEFNVPVNITVGSGSVLFKYEETTADKADQGEHNHSYSTGTLTPSVYRRENVLIQKTGSSALVYPSSALVFGLPGIQTPNRVRSTAWQGRVLKAAAANALAGLANEFVPITTGSTDDTHKHHTKTLFSNQQRPIDFTTLWWDADEAGGAHTHDLNLVLAKNLKVYRLALYAGTDDYTVAPGDIGMWAGAITGSPDPLPTGWTLCDGTLGTPDLRDHFIEIAADGEEGASGGDNSITVTTDGTEDPVTHEHKDGAENREAIKVQQIAHSNNQAHVHAVSDSDTWQPPYYVLYFIMYNPSA